MNTKAIGQWARLVSLLGQRLRFRRAGMLAILLCSSGCIAIPIPTPEHTPMDTVTRQNIGPDTTEWIQPGKTSLTDVLLKLGEPDQVSPDGRKLAYRWQKVRAYVLVGVPGGGDVVPWLKDYYLVIECDLGGVVRNKRISDRLLIKASLQELFESGAAAAGPVADAEINISGPAEWFPGVNGYDWLRKKWWTMGDPPKGTRGQVILTTNALYFQERGQLLNGTPALALRFEGLSECHLDKYGLGRRLVVWTKMGEVHSFTFWGAREMMEDRKAAESAFGIVQSRIRQSSHVDEK